MFTDVLSLLAFQTLFIISCLIQWVHYGNDKWIIFLSSCWHWILPSDYRSDEETHGKDDEEKQPDCEVKTEERTKGKKKKHKYKDVQIGEVSSTTDLGDMSFVDNYTARKHLLLKPAPKWFNYEVSKVKKWLFASEDNDVFLFGVLTWFLYLFLFISSYY